MKKEYFLKVNGLDGEMKEMSEDDKINMNMIRSVDESLEVQESNFTTMEPYEMENETQSQNESLSDKVKRDVEAMKSLFHSAVKMVRSGKEELAEGSDLVSQVAKRMLRKKRELESEGSMMKEMDMDYCIVKNMTCNKFPLKSKCKGLGLGRCGGNADLIKMLLTPHVIMVSSVSIIVIVMVTVALTYYCYKMKTENRIEPAEDEVSRN